MSMYMCSICGKGVSSGENHKCSYPINVFSNKMVEEEKKNPFKSINFPIKSWKD